MFGILDLFRKRRGKSTQVSEELGFATLYFAYQPYLNG